jgi:hypothetical protein
MRTRSLVAALGIWFAGALPAAACGGLFCARIPVDQTGEKILFATDGKEVTAHVQIAYKGDAKSFSWIVPVPTAPKLGVGSDALFTALREATRPQFQLSLRDEGPCDPPPMPTLKAGVAEGAVNRQAMRGGVTVVSQEQVGPYDTAVLQANDAGVLKAWLRKNDYVIPPKLDPLLDPYVAGKYSFVALKLTKDKAVGDIQPIVMTYKATKPGVPIRLTGVAATPDMDVFVWVLGKDRSVPENYRHAQINEARIDWVNGGSNYRAVVTRAVDEAGGQAFVTDYAGPTDVVPAEKFSRSHFRLDSLAKKTDPVEFATAVVENGFFGERFGNLNQEALMAFLKKYIAKPKSLHHLDDPSFYRFIESYRAQLRGTRVDTARAVKELEAKVVEPSSRIQAMLERHRYMTAMYTTMSPAEMTQDPTFRFNSFLPDVAAVRHAEGVRRCKKGVPYWQSPIEIKLANGRRFTVPGSGPGFFKRFGSLPAAARIEQLHAEGPASVIQDNEQAIDIALAGGTPPRPDETPGGYWGLAAGLLVLGGLGYRRLKR